MATQPKDKEFELGVSYPVDLDASNIEDDDDEDGVEVEIIDDTPDEDKDRQPLPKRIVEDLEQEEAAEEYSAKVKERIKQLKKAWHDERRAKEATQRENAEFTDKTKLLFGEVQNLRKQLGEGESWALGEAKRRAELELEKAKSLYKAAYDEADPDKLADAQEAMSRAVSHFDRVSTMKPRYEGLQNAPEPVYNQPQRQPQAAPQPKVAQAALDWGSKNDWFGTDDEMTSFALGVHKKLVEGGTPPDTDEYYEKLDSRMRQVFSDYFAEEGQDLESGEPKNKKQTQRPTTIVAPVSRTPKGTKVALTKSQLAIAKKLGVSPEQYAKEVSRLSKGN